jgi:hypothetical protein
MDFTSIKEYFYKLYSYLLIIMLVPIFIFIAVNILPSDRNLVVTSEQSMMITTVIVLILITSLIFHNKKIKSIRNRQGLREKLEKYFELTIVRYTSFCVCCVALAFAYYYSNDAIFLYLFLVHLIVSAVVWPLSSKVSRDLKLRGDEYQMVYYRKDEL